MTEKTEEIAGSGPVSDADYIGADNSLLIVDDDGPFLRRLARAMETRGFAVDTAESVAEGIAKTKTSPPKYAVVDLRLGDGSGLDVIAAIRQRRDDTRIIMLTGYGNIATAVNAVKLGAVDYLAKPADADDIFSALTQKPGEKALAPPAVFTVSPYVPFRSVSKRMVSLESSLRSAQPMVAPM